MASSLDAIAGHTCIICQSNREVHIFVSKTWELRPHFNTNSKPKPQVKAKCQSRSHVVSLPGRLRCHAPHTTYRPSSHTASNPLTSSAFSSVHLDMISIRSRASLRSRGSFINGIWLAEVYKNILKHRAIGPSVNQNTTGWLGGTRSPRNPPRVQKKRSPSSIGPFRLLSRRKDSHLGGSCPSIPLPDNRIPSLLLRRHRVAYTYRAVDMRAVCLERRHRFREGIGGDVWNDAFALGETLGRSAGRCKEANF